MKTVAIAFAAAGLFVAGAAAAATGASDVDYLKANRCKGLAVGLGSAETGSFDAFIKAEGRGRQATILERADGEFAKAKRAAARVDGRERVTAELSGPCMAYTASGKDAPSAR